jgi:DNA polymerase elongation subunit (family B)
MIELCMMTGASPEDVLSISPGRLNTYLHIAAARRRGHVIPEFKKEMERPKSLALLRAMDKGGIIFYPEPGIYAQVAKCDFASMYPSIIVNYNISPEMMDCSCGNFHEVPESGWKICKARQGVIPEGIQAVLERRLALKKLMKAEKDPALKEGYNLRQKALKNLLVVSFGYLGFKNFIFSNVECKECVMLYGRHILVRTKEIAEQMGLEVVYGIVDSVFVKGGTEKEYLEFVKAVSKEIGVTLELDCIFRKIAFPCADDGSGVANKYYGIDPDGEVEARGIAIRHSDSPQFIKDFQSIVIPLLLSEEGLEAGLKIAESVRSEFEEKILRKIISLESLAITKSVRKDPDDYLNQAAHVVAFKQMPNASGVSVYIHTTRGPKPLALASLQMIDCKKYLQLLEQSMEELVKGIKKEKEELKLGAYC